MARIGQSLVGQKFGRLTAIARAPDWKWCCICDCGGSKTVRRDALLSGSTRSCGCLLRESASKNGKARATHGMTKSRIYRVWVHMVGRCKNPKDTTYKWYGARGIRVCKRWGKFENFLADMGEPPSGMEIERNDNEKGYFQRNCRWATHKEQMNNTRRNVFLTAKGKTMTMTAWANLTGIKVGTIWRRLQLGWAHEKAIGGGDS